MDKISFIPQMRGFIAKMQEDRLPPNAVKLYLCLFDVFNKSCWRKEWVRVNVCRLKLCFGTNSSSMIYNNRRILEDFGYIQVRSGYDGHQRYTEFKLINLYDGNNVVPDIGTTCGTTLSDRTNPVPYAGTTCGTTLSNRTNPVPYAGTTCGTTHGTRYGTTSPSEPLHCKGSRLPNKKEEEKEGRLLQGIPNRESIQNIGSSPRDTGSQEHITTPTGSSNTAGASSGGIYQETFQVFGICFGREAQVDEKLDLIDLIKRYTRDSVEAALMAIADEHQAYSKELCQRYIQRQLCGLASPAPRRREPVPGWGGFRPA